MFSLSARHWRALDKDAIAENATSFGARAAFSELRAVRVK
jgi:hypothetical protein